MSCTPLDNNFLNINSFSYVSEICEGGAYFLVSTIVNIVLSAATIYFGQQRLRSERTIQFIVNKYSADGQRTKEWVCEFRDYIFWLACNQLSVVLNFIFLVYTNIVQLLLSAFLQVLFRSLYYYYDIIPNDNKKLRYDLVQEEKL